MIEGKKTTPEEAPPILRAWSRLYALVLIGLALCILLLYLFERAFS